jgi:hypothetical protein
VPSDVGRRGVKVKEDLMGGVNSFLFSLPTFPLIK